MSKAQQRIIPTRATPHLSAHAMAHHTFKQNQHVPTRMSTCHGCECDSPYPMSRVFTDSLTHAYVECEKPNHHYVPSRTIFQNKRFLFYKQKPLDGLQYQLALPKLCVFMHLWITDFRVYTVGRRSPFQHFYSLSLSLIMSNSE